MCLPVCCLKKLVQFEGWIILLLSLLSLVAAIIVHIFEKTIIEVLNNLGYDDIQSLGVATAFWIFTGAIFGLALCGIIGAKKRSKCLLAIFNLGNICVFLAFLSLAIVAYILGNDFTLPPCEDSQSLEDYYQLAESQLCKQGCECYFTGNVTSVQGAVINYSREDKNKATKFQECIKFKEATTQQQFFAKGFSHVEEKMECSGWCKTYPIQIFNNVNSPVKADSKGCYDSLIAYGQQVGISIGNVLISIAGVLGLFVLFPCCLCCHPETKHKTTDYYSRMAYYDE